MKSCTVQLIILKNGGKIMIKWFKRLINMCLNNGEDIQDGNVPYATSIFEEKGDRINCTSNRGIICLTFHGKGKGNQLSYKKKWRRGCGLTSQKLCLDTGKISALRN